MDGVQNVIQYEQLDAEFASQRAAFFHRWLVEGPWGATAQEGVRHLPLLYACLMRLP